MKNKLFQHDSHEYIFTNLYPSLCLIALIIHCLFAFTFIQVGITPLVLYNLVGSLVYIVLFVLARRKLTTIVSISFFIEIMIFVIISSISVGWDYGFYLYLFPLIPMSFYCKFKFNATKFITSSSIFAVFLALYFVDKEFDVLYTADEYYVRLIFIINALICFLFILGLSYIYSKASNSSYIRLREKNKNLQILASTDPLTGLLNRRSMFIKLEETKHLYDTQNEIFSLILVDIDNFKFINDDYGHQCGDVVLNNICNIIKNTVRKDDIICRWGGEEILVLLPNTELAGGKAVAEKLRGNVEAFSTIYKDHFINTTITAGVCCASDTETINGLVNLADKCLYKGKAAGKNCVVGSR